MREVFRCNVGLKALYGILLAYYLIQPDRSILLDPDLFFNSIPPFT